MIDIGCGAGHDSFAFAESGRHVVGIDRSEVAIRLASERARLNPPAGGPEFVLADVADGAALRTTLTDLTQRAPAGPVLFYLRFLLHAVPAKTQNTLIRTLAGVVRTGDQLAVEFRAIGDSVLEKAHGEHFRRFQDGPAFGEPAARVRIHRAGRGRGHRPGQLSGRGSAGLPHHRPPLTTPRAHRALLCPANARCAAEFA